MKYTAVYIAFPTGDVKCATCPLLETYSRNMCRRTGEYITDTRGRGYYCPLIEITEKEARELLTEREV
jgi:hypothetical protein